MNYPFPGMNPYLENPDLWSELHHRLITAIADCIEPSLSQEYRVAIEKRTYMSLPEESLLIGIPDVSVIATSTKTKSSKSNTAVMTLPAKTETETEIQTVTLPIPIEIKEAYLEIKESKTGRVITVIEVLSPTNKKKGKGLNAYLEKRENVLMSYTNLIEIDLLRSGQMMPILGDFTATDYRILIARSKRLPRAELMGFNLGNSIPSFKIPLQRGDEEPVVNLQNLLEEIYQKARFYLTLDYSQEPPIKLSDEEQIWLDNLLKEKGLR